MNAADWSAAAEIFADALERPPVERQAFVAARCAGRPDLHAAVAGLLAAEHAADPAFMQHLPAGAAALVREGRVPPERIGAWRVVREIGSGGMGQVYLAERADGLFEQRVAIKLLKRGMDSDAILGRFLRERRILAALEHPNIARLIDGGVAEDSRPYFVMEYVEGVPLTRYADDHALGLDERLELFDAVCGAVVYAHRSLVVHRDLKPANILVAPDGRPKLLDFGIARVIAAPDAADDDPTLGDPAGAMLTPDYAAPEQFRGGPITTATDVYGAGAVLFELLSGRRPFTAEQRAMRMAGLSDPEPPPVSSVAPAERRRRLRGDLDTIVATALRAPPERRYPSVEMLREDLRRHRRRLPVSARRDSVGYRASRFVRRHRTGVAAAAIVTALVLAFAVTSAVQSHRIRRTAAELAAARDRAEQEAAAARAVTEFLVGIFEVADPQAGGAGDSLRAVQLLDRGAERIEAELGAEPALQARLLGAIGRAYDNLRESDRAEPIARRALALERQLSAGGGPAVVDALRRLARVQARRGSFAAAESTLAEALAMHAADTGAADPLTLSLLVDLAGVLHGRGRHELARPVVARAAAMFERIPPERFTDSPAELASVAELLSFAGTAEQMERAWAQLAAGEEARAGARSPAVAAVLTDWGAARRRRGDVPGADSALSLALAIHRERDPTSLPAGHTLLALADVAVGRGAAARADTLYREALEVFRARLGEEHRMVATTRTQLAETLNRAGRFAEAVPLYRQAIATYARSPGDAARLVPPAQWRLATALLGAGRPGEAMDAFAASLRGFEAAFPADYLLTANLRRDYGAALVDAGRFAEAQPMLRRAVDVLGKRWGAEDRRTAVAQASLRRAEEGLRGRR